MKKIIVLLILVCCFANLKLIKGNNGASEVISCAKSQSLVSTKSVEEISCYSQTIDLAPTAKSAYICDETGKIEVFSKNPNERLTIASMTKIMLLNLVFDAVDDKSLSLDEEITVSERASSMGGSQVFLQANKNYKVSDLIKSVIIASANDATVALSERLFGSEEACVDKMNSLANEWGLENTLFSNTTGLPKPTQYSCAKDVAVMLAKLIKHDKYFDFSKIWLDELVHPDGQKTVLTNTNKLVKFYSGCDGGKTGFTSESKYCIATTAKKNNMRVISVVIGEPSSKERFSDVSEMFNYAFNNYENKQIIDETAILRDDITVLKGNKKTISVSAKESFNAFIKKGEKVEYTYELKPFENLRAPIVKGQTVGEIIVYNGNVEVGKFDIVSNDDVLRKNIFDSLKEVLNGWKV